MSKEVKIGIFSILIVVCAILGYRFIRGQNPLGGAQIIKSRFHDIDQLAVSAPVLMRGLQIGTVSDRYIDEIDHKSIIIEMAIDREFAIPKDAIASLENTSLVGGKQINIKYSNPCEGNCAGSGDFITGEAPNIIATLIGQENIDSLGARVKSSFGGGMGDSINAQDMLANFATITENLAELTESINSNMDGITRSLNSSLRSMSSVSKNLEANNATITEALSNIEVLTRKLSALEPSKTIDLANGSLEQAQKTFEGLNSTVAGTKKSIEELEKMLAKMNDVKGSMGKLINDPSLYENLDNTSRELTLLLQDFRLNPKRYVNVSVFGKKQKEYALPDDDPAQIDDK